LGQAVHRRTVDHLPTDTTYARLNKRVALALTSYVGTMTCFCVFKDAFPTVLIKASIIALVAWVAQTFIQLVLLPALMVGQNLQNAAADARAAKTFEDVEDARNCIKEALQLLDVHTEGGIKVILDAVESLKTPR
jgi:cobalamin biosynthesis protein CobD/CbiB